MDDKQDLQSILYDLAGQGFFDEEDDRSLEKGSETEAEKYGVEYVKRNRDYSQLLHDYVKHHKKKEESNKKYKFAFFVVIMVMFIVIIGFSLYLIYKVSAKEYLGLSGISVVLGSTSGIISSIIILPKIIAQHLFPQDEDKHILGIVQNMQQHDERLRNIENTPDE